MQDEACVAFLRWCLPQLQLRWPGYRKVRRLVGKRLDRRLSELGLANLSAYRAFLSREPEEWSRLDAICHIPISRFYRDRRVFDLIGQRILPEVVAAAVARGDATARCWSAGCASGEEPYTIALICRHSADPACQNVHIVATDADATMLARATSACYSRSSLKELPRAWIETDFIPADELLCLRPAIRRNVVFALEDIRHVMPDGLFDLILCRNLVFTYFDEDLQRDILLHFRTKLREGGFLVVGMHEALPPSIDGFEHVVANLPIYRRK